MSRQNDSVPVTVHATVRRKAPQLPAYVEIPSSALAPWRLEGTTTVLASFDGGGPVRRSLKPWDAERWFMDLSQPILRSGGFEVGSEVEVGLVLAPTDLPDELATLLKEDREAATRWDRMSPSRRRAIREHVLAAAKSETRRRRSRKALCGPD